MATTTTKLSLIKPDLTDIVDVANLNDNADSIDAAVGFTICTSATRPATPWAGQTIFETDTTSSFVWDGSAWQAAGGGGGSITVSATAPVSPPPGNGDLWWDSDNGNMYIYYEDVDSSQWVAANGPQVFVGAAAPAGYQGQMWFDSSTGKMYVFYDDGTSSQWVSAIGGSVDIATSQLPAGTILQVVSTTKTDSFSLATQDTWTDITDLSIDITPRSTSSKIYLIAEIGYLDGSAAMALGFRFTRDGTAIGLGDQVGSNRERATFARIVDTAARGETASGTFLDSPSTSSTITYKLQLNKMDAGTAYINYAGSSDTDANNRFRTLSSITAIEVAG